MNAPPSGGQTTRPSSPSSVSLPLHHASAALAQVMRFDLPIDTVLSRYWRTHRVLGRRERDFISHVIYGVVRQLGVLRARAGEKADARALILLWLQTHQHENAYPPLTTYCSAAELGWLTGLESDLNAPLSPAQQANLPQWLYDLLAEQYGLACLSAMTQAWQQNADTLDIRVNTLKTRIETVQNALRDQGLHCERMAWSPCGLRLAGKPALQTHPLFVAGHFEIQNEGSQLTSLLLAPRRDQIVADFCAGAGGKSLQLSAMMQNTGKIYAFDIAEKRLAVLRQRATRAAASNIQTICLEHENDHRLQRFANKMQCLLVDAPCSGLGTLRSHPELKWRYGAAEIQHFAQRQQAILQAAAQLVAPGGRLAYVTCSILGAENEAVARFFEETQAHFKAVHAGEILQAQKININAGKYLHLLPHQHGSDGFFAALWQRVA